MAETFGHLLTRITYSLKGMSLEPDLLGVLPALAHVRTCVCILLSCLLSVVSEMHLIYPELSGPFLKCQRKKQGKGLEQ